MNLTLDGFDPGFNKALANTLEWAGLIGWAIKPVNDIRYWHLAEVTVTLMKVRCRGKSGQHNFHSI